MGIQRQDLSFCPTQHGYLFLGILVAMLLGAVNYNNNAGFILVFLLGGMAVISLFHSVGNLTGITLVPKAVQPVFKGDTIVFPIEVKGAPGQARSLFLSTADSRPVHVSLSKAGIPGANLKLAASDRGIFPVDHVALTSVYPFGLFRFKALVPIHARGLVYPAPVRCDFPSGSKGEQGDGQKRSRRQGPDDFQGLKPYTPGNPVSRIAWKALSRGQGVFIKDFTAETGKDIFLDLDRIKQGDIEHRLSMICHRILRAEKQGLRYGLGLGSAFSRMPDRGTSHLHCCLEALARYCPGKNTGPEET